MRSNSYTAGVRKVICLPKPHYFPARIHHLFISFYLLCGLFACSGIDERLDEHIGPMRSIAVPDSAHYAPDSGSSIFNTVAFLAFEQQPVSSFSVIDKIVQFQDRYIILDRMVSSKVLAFDTTGKFLFTYGSKGNQKGQYIVPMDFFLDTVQKELIVLNSERRKVNYYDYATGKFLRDASYDFSAKLFHKFNNGRYVFIGGSRQDRVILTDEKLVKENSLIPYIPRYATMLINQLQPIGDSILAFRLSFNDTVYRVTNNGKVYPYLFVDFGASRLTNEYYNSLTPEQQGRLQDHVLEKRSSLLSYSESDRHIYFVYRYRGDNYSFIANKDSREAFYLPNNGFTDTKLPVERLPIIVGQDGHGNFLAALTPEDIVDNQKLKAVMPATINDFSNPVLIRMTFK